jgi:hypothetical protein
MASGQTLDYKVANSYEPPSSAAATPSKRGTTDIPVLEFSPSASETALFGCYMPRKYGGGGVTVTIGWMATDVTVGPDDVRWDVAFKSVTPDADDLDTKSFAAVNSVTSTEPSASGETQDAAITFTDGADMDSVAAGEYYRLKVTRDHDHADDDLGGDAELLYVEIKET